MNNANESRRLNMDAILTVVCFILLLIISILQVFALVSIIDGIAHILIALFMIAFLFDSDVKSKMNM